MKKHKNLYPLLIVIAVIAALNLVSSFWYFRVDLTSEKRYTLSDVTINIANELTKPVYVTLYLNGELNPGFRRLRRSTIETLQEIGYHANSNLHIINIDPTTLSKEEGQKLENNLANSGYGGVPVYETKEDGQKTRTIVYPYLLINIGDAYVWINLLENIPGLTGEESLNRSIEDIEYKLSDAITRLVRQSVPRIAFLEGHGELDELDVISATEALSEHFAVDRGEIADDPSILYPYKVLIIAKPSSQFSEKDKYAIDQYLMQGGRILWLVDAVTMTLDSLRNLPHTIGLTAELNLDDLLFRYGIRIRSSVIEDIACGMIPISVPKQDGGSQIVPMPWLYGPLMATNMLSPITRNVSYVHGDFSSPIDTVGDGLNITRTPLLRSSANTKAIATPVMAQLSTIHQQPDLHDFTQSHLMLAVLEEGEFTSAFSHRRTPSGINTNGIKPLEKSVPTKMIFVGDGDIIRNDVRFRHTSNPTIIPLGYDEVSRQNYGNKDFIVNAVQYLADDNGMMALRNRTFALRLLDRQKITQGTTIYKVVAITIPLLLIVIIGAVITIVRRRQYARKR